MAGGMSRIKNLVVVMMENRSFDNLLGWLYGPGTPPAQVIGGRAGDPSFFGLTPGSYWNPANASFFQGERPRRSSRPKARPARPRSRSPIRTPWKGSTT